MNRGKWKRQSLNNHIRETSMIVPQEERMEPWEYCHSQMSAARSAGEQFQIVHCHWYSNHLLHQRSFALCLQFAPVSNQKY